jgi:hypothetical protein
MTNVNTNDNIDDKSTVEKPKTDKESNKYKLMLKLVNKILVNINKPQIDDLTKFIDIDREDIIKETNTKILDDMADELFEEFNKSSSGYYRKTNAIVLNCLRGMCKELGFQFNHKRKEKSETINGKSYKRTHLLYSMV